MVVVRCVDVAAVLVERTGQVALERVVVLLLLHVRGTAARYWRCSFSIRLGSTLVAVYVGAGDTEARVAAEITLSLQSVLQPQGSKLRRGNMRAHHAHIMHSIQQTLTITHTMIYSLLC